MSIGVENMGSNERKCREDGLKCLRSLSVGLLRRGGEFLLLEWQSLKDVNSVVFNR